MVADRANARLQYFTLEGVHESFVDSVSFPADFDTQGEVLLVPDLHARITLYDKNNTVITHLGYSEDWTKKALGNGFEMRKKPEMSKVISRLRSTKRAQPDCSKASIQALFTLPSSGVN